MTHSKLSQKNASTCAVTSWEFSTHFKMYTDPLTFDFVCFKKGHLTHQTGKYKNPATSSGIWVIYCCCCCWIHLEAREAGQRLIFQKAAGETFRSGTKIVFALKHVKHFLGREKGLK